MVAILNVFESVIEIVGRKTLSWILVVLSLFFSIFNYSHYGSDALVWESILAKDSSILGYIIAYYEMTIMYFQHLGGFFIQFWNEDLKYLTWTNYEKIGETIYDIYKVYTMFFLNIMSLTFMFLAIYIRTKGSFIKRLKAPFQASIYILATVLFLTLFATDLSNYINSDLFIRDINQITKILKGL